ncbi:hypothetical protein BH11BAC2_BH11BAC2_24930 [soil metagenome]
MQDVTDLKKVSIKSKKKDASLRSVIENTDDYIFILNKQEELVVFNQQFCTAMLDFFHIELVTGLKIADELPEMMQAQWRTYFTRAFQGERFSEETGLIIGNAEYRMDISVNPIVIDEELTGIAFFIKDVTTRWKFNQVDLLENRVMEQAFRHQDLNEVLYTLLSGIEDLIPGMHCYSTLRNGDLLEWLVAPRLSRGVMKAIPKIPIGPNMASCGTAAYTGKPVLVMDIRQSDYWVDFRDATILYGYESCLAFPILNAKSEVIGTIGAMYHKANSANDFDLELLDRAVRITAILMEKYVTEKNLTLQNKKISEISNAIPGIIFEVSGDVNGNRKFTYFSDKVMDHLGYAPDELIGNYNAIWACIHPQDLPLVQSSLADSIRDSTLWNQQFRVNKKGETAYRWFRVNAQHNRNAEGGSSSQGTFTDITELKENELSLLEAKESLNGVINSMNDFICEISGDGVIMNVWSDDESKLVAPVKEIIGKKVEALASAEIAAAYYENAEKALQTGKPQEFEYEMFIHNKNRNYKARVGLIQKVSVSAAHFYVTIQNITENKRKELIISKQQTIIRKAGELAKVGAFEFNINTHELIWSDQLYEIFGIDKSIAPEDLYNAYIARIHPDDITALNQKVALALQKGENYSGEHRIVLDDGTEKWVNGKSEVMMDDEKNPAFITGICQDITENKNAEKKILQNLQEKENLIREIKHLAKNNLGIIASLLQLQQLYHPEGFTAKMLQQSQSQLKSMSLIHDKLFYVNDSSHVNFSAYINEIANDVMNAFPNPDAAITIESEIEEVTFDIAYAVPCGLIVNELLTNVFRYAFKGRKEGVVKITLMKADDLNCLLEVQDNGIGLPKDFNEEKSGSLGMNLIRTLAHQMNGKIFVSGENGTRVTLEFPIDQHKNKEVDSYIQETASTPLI